MRLSRRPVASVAQAARLDKDYKILLDALGFGLASPDTLVERIGLYQPFVACPKLLLRLEDIVGQHSGSC
jgi:hypothetical protein